jgi:hypothetical protein
MSPLRTIARDLVDRRLWPVAALLAVGLVAIPMLFLRPAPNAVSETPAPAAAPAAPATPAATPAASAAAPADPTADPSVALTSSPFAAAFAGPLDLPPSMQGLLRATKGADDRRTVADAPLRDPFSAGIASVKPAAAASSSSGSAAAPSAAASAPASDAGGSTTPASTPAPVAGPSSPTDTPSTPASTPSPTPAPSDPAPAADWRIFTTDVSFGTTETAPTDGNATRLTAYPSSFNPVAIFLGVMRGGWGAVFMLRDDVRPVGAPSCRPRKTICTWVILHPGESVTLNAKDATGTVTPYSLKVAAIREDTASEAAAKAAYAKADAAGRCLLGPLAAYHYDAQTGTLAPRPELKACTYQGDDATGAPAPAAPADQAAPATG